MGSFVFLWMITFLLCAITACESGDPSVSRPLPLLEPVAAPAAAPAPDSLPDSDGKAAPLSPAPALADCCASVDSSFEPSAPRRFLTATSTGLSSVAVSERRNRIP